MGWVIGIIVVIILFVIVISNIAVVQQSRAYVIERVRNRIETTKCSMQKMLKNKGISNSKCRMQNAKLVLAARPNRNSTC